MSQDEKTKVKEWLFERYVEKFEDDPDYQKELWERFEEREVEDYLWD